MEIRWIPATKRSMERESPPPSIHVEKASKAKETGIGAN